MSVDPNGHSTNYHQSSAQDSGLDVNCKHSPAVSINQSQLLASPRDIICGRGLHIVNHRGNLNLHLIVNNHRDVYLSSGQAQKAKIIKRILREIKSTGARFIRRVSDGNDAERWEAVDEATAYKKVSHALRLRTKNESNRDDGILTKADKAQSLGDSNTDALNPVALKKLRPTFTSSAASVPLETNHVSAPHNRRRTVLAKPTDIICGRGMHIASHRGNLDLHLMVNVYREEYQKSLRSHKRKIAVHILNEIKRSGARFVRKVSDGNGAEVWEVVDETTAFNKVSHALRLRTKNSSNSDNGAIAAADAFHHEAGASIIESHQRKHRPPTLPETPGSLVTIEEPHHPRRGRPSIRGVSIPPSTSSTGTTTASLQLPLESVNEAWTRQAPARAGIAAPDVARASTVLSNFSHQQRLQQEANLQAYWNIAYALMQQSDDLTFR